MAAAPLPASAGTGSSPAPSLTSALPLPASAGPGAASVHSVLVTTMAEIIGISVLAIVADSSDTAGKVAVALMAGWLLIFLMSNAAWLQSIFGKL